ncbi:DNA-binding transcriptional regulator, MarR family [Candidatus Kryptonium thompsonii]|uniref:DNA-binding transcriptional regulator, MarR family n=1 Tax=Candidatus Kryptonium thompsonii TaxID=1633631 RepID=A0A0P1LLS7_9BACT|nr:MarR family winged helix-turn-helix transcriptional regulator [Candidatus Kryptonium thompsoni]CUS77984.1 DNA-binding transcriptional regulator, MarR family [Candidatus Kryptonium thompsoni]CUS80472.1 DNA-binding transcriptional regulator, MarR family [Candidatus Kryptonium thompsoni]CUS82193.1 DNA-binding transcriptional regulator, MarR family [Candidatus Kryptonium thompsoni]CUS82302.1 DNA-binding transcriptional regulator, MarR family [Candidatus Kryptonium thompsoni]CUS83290.1 DNA-bindi
MAPVFDPIEQNENIDSKIIAGLERISRVFRLLLWDIAKDENLSPIQIQFLIFLLYNKPSRRRITDIANEFNLTKATVSDAISSLEEKNLIEKDKNTEDKRSYAIKLTPKGKKLAKQLSIWADVLKNNLKNFNQEEKEAVLKFIFKLIESLYEAGIITIQRMCFSCLYFQRDIHPNPEAPHHCNFLNKPLSIVELRLDCEDYAPIESN